MGVHILGLHNEKINKKFFHTRSALPATEAWHHLLIGHNGSVITRCCDA
jgi:hypothetical protein